MFPESTMAAYRDLPLPLVIACLLFIRGHSPLPTTSRATPAFKLDTDDYQLLETQVPITKSPIGGNLQRCKYDPCVVGQSCFMLAAAIGCLCPGTPLYGTAPLLPELKSVSWNGSEVVIQWCAPDSHVTGYVVKVGGKELQKFGKDRRSSTLGDINHVTTVCVVAVNDSGASGESCKTYHPRDSGLPLKAGLIGGALGFLLLLLLAVLLLRHRRQRKQGASISSHDTAETQ